MQDYHHPLSQGISEGISWYDHQSILSFALHLSEYYYFSFAEVNIPLVQAY